MDRGRRLAGAVPRGSKSPGWACLRQTYSCAGWVDGRGPCSRRTRSSSSARLTCARQTTPSPRIRNWLKRNRSHTGTYLYRGLSAGRGLPRSCRHARRPVTVSGRGRICRSRRSPVLHRRPPDLPRDRRSRHGMGRRSVCCCRGGS